MEFEWDENKNKINKKKHGLSFLEAANVFLDPRKIIKQDLEHSTLDEEREIVIGRIKEIVIIFVSYTDRSGVTRIISARPAEQEEIDEYYRENDIGRN